MIQLECLGMNSSKQVQEGLLMEGLVLDFKVFLVLKVLMNNLDKEEISKIPFKTYLRILKVFLGAVEMRELKLEEKRQLNLKEKIL